MKSKAVSGTMLTLLLIGMLTLAFDVQPVKAGGTIYIRADGSVYPDTTPISSVDNVTYTFTDNIYDSIVVERNSIVVDGAGYTLQGTGETGYIIPSPPPYGFYLSGRSGVTIKNIKVRAWMTGINLAESSGNTLSGNNIIETGVGIQLLNSSGNTISGNKPTDNHCGIQLLNSSANSISGNNITNNGFVGILLDYYSSGNTISGNNIKDGSFVGILLDYYSSGNTISGNNIEENSDAGIYLRYSSGNIIFGNNITRTGRGIYLLYSSSGNIIFGNNITNQHAYGVHLYESSNNNFCHNNFIDNTQQVYIFKSGANFWDDDYPSGGNYWSDHITVDDYSGVHQNELGSDGIVDEPYIIDDYNRDNYPLVKPYGVAHDIGITGITPSETSVEPGSMLDINITVMNYGLYTETFNLTAYVNTTVISQTEVTLSSGNSATITFTWDTTDVTLGTYTLKAQASVVPGETHTTDNYFEDGVATIVTPEYLTQKLIETIKTWNLPDGTENSLTSKLEEAILLLNMGNENGAIHKLLDFINQVEALREEKLTIEQANYLISEAQEIIDLIEG